MFSCKIQLYTVKDTFYDKTRKVSFLFFIFYFYFIFFLAFTIDSKLMVIGRNIYIPFFFFFLINTFIYLLFVHDCKLESNIKSVIIVYCSSEFGG